MKQNDTKDRQLNARKSYFKVLIMDFLQSMFKNTSAFTLFTHTHSGINCSVLCNVKASNCTSVVAFEVTSLKYTDTCPHGTSLKETLSYHKHTSFHTAPVYLTQQLKFLLPSFIKKRQKKISCSISFICKHFSI